MQNPALSDIIVELHVDDFNIVKDFYEKLGFEVIWEKSSDKENGYLVLKRENSILTFLGGNQEVYNHDFFKNLDKNTPRGYGVEIAIYISDKNIENYYAETIGKIEKNFIVQPLLEKPWGTKDFRLKDPFGYYLCIREADNILEKY